LQIIEDCSCEYNANNFDGRKMGSVAGTRGMHTNNNHDEADWKMKRELLTSQIMPPFKVLLPLAKKNITSLGIGFYLYYIMLQKRINTMKFRYSFQ